MARLMAVSRSASAVATSASRLMRATSGLRILGMYSFLSRTSLIVNEITSRPILFMSAAQVPRMRSETISGCFTISSTVSWPMMPRRWPSITNRIRPSRSWSLLVRNCSAAVKTDSRSDFTLICATASTVTATPCFVYRSCCGATSNDISSSDRSRQVCTMGSTSVPCPCTTRVPPKPYTMSASCGPALRYSLAIPLIRNRRTITPSPAKIQISTIFDISNINASSCQCSSLRLSIALDHVQIVHDPLRIAVAQKNFPVVHFHANSASSPDIGFMIADPANAKPTQGVPALNLIVFDLQQGNRFQPEPQCSNLHSMAAEVVMKSVPRHGVCGGRDCRNQPKSEPDGRVGNRESDRSQRDYGHHKNQKQSLARMNFFRQHLRL